MKISEQYTEIVGYWHQPETSEDMARGIYNEVVQIENTLFQLRSAWITLMDQYGLIPSIDAWNMLPEDLQEEMEATRNGCVT